jgi:hypothetical protein
MKIDKSDWAIMAVVLISGASIWCRSSNSSPQSVLDGLQGAVFISALIIGWRTYLFAKENTRIAGQAHQLNRDRAEIEANERAKSTVRSKLELKIEHGHSPVDDFKEIFLAGYTFEMVHELLDEVTKRHYPQGPTAKQKLMQWVPRLESVYQSNPIELETLSEQIRNLQDSKKNPPQK